MPNIRTKTIPVTNSGDEDELKRLRSANPIYEELRPEWELYLAAYTGGPKMITPENLFRHVRENQEDYLDRTKRIDYWNYCGPIVDYYTNFLFSEMIQRDGGSDAEFYQRFKSNVDKRGSDVDTYMRGVSTDSKIYGYVFIQVDMPSLPPDRRQILSKADELALGLEPYWILIRPDEILDWVVDDFDNLLYFKRVQRSRVLKDGQIVLLEKYTEFTADTVKVTLVNVTDKKNNTVDSATTVANPWGFIPLVIHRFKHSKHYPYIGESMLIDFAYNNRSVMNYTSLIQEFNYRQCFNVLTKEADPAYIPVKDQNDGDWGSSNIIEYPKGAAAPNYISPPADPAEFLQSERSKCVAEMYRRAQQDTMNELANGEKASGYSQTQSFSKTVPFISNQADMLERTETRLMEITMKMKGGEWKGAIKYKDSYTVTNIFDALQQLTIVFKDLAFPSETFIKEELKRIVLELDGKINPDRLRQIMDEIDNMDVTKWKDTVQSTKGVAAQNNPKQTNSLQEIAQESKQESSAVIPKKAA